jgi:hypothetical protein
MNELSGVSTEKGAGGHQIIRGIYWRRVGYQIIRGIYRRSAGYQIIREI